MTFSEATLVFGKDGKSTSHVVVWEWGVFNEVFNRCSLVTMCMLRDVCTGFRLAVDHAFKGHAEKIGVDMGAVAKQVEDMVDVLGMQTVEMLTSGQLPVVPPDPGCCKKCARKARLSQKLMARLKTKVSAEFVKFMTAPTPESKT